MRSARAALPAWRDLTGRQRGAYLNAGGRAHRAHADELGELVSRESGKPKRDALANDVAFSSNCFEFFAGPSDSLPGEIIDQGPIETRVVYEPYGVVACILPFNWPPIHFAKKGAPALITGNTVVIKPGEQAPLTVLRLVEIANEVLPPGVLNAVPGLTAGAALAGHPERGAHQFHRCHRHRQAGAGDRRAEPDLRDDGTRREERADGLPRRRSRPGGHRLDRGDVLQPGRGVHVHGRILVQDDRVSTASWKFTAAATAARGGRRAGSADRYRPDGRRETP